MDKAKELYAKADQYAAKAAATRKRTARNTYLSLEHSFRELARHEEQARDGGQVEAR